jgi:hypothetical protein
MGFAMAVLFSGLGRWAGAVVTALALAFMVAQYRKWNGSPWRQLHFRAMLAYARIAGLQQARAQAQGRAFDLHAACTELGVLLCGPEKGAAIDAMIESLAAEQGTYLAGLFDRHVSTVAATLQPSERSEMIDRLRGVTLGPQLVVAHVLENTHGPIEATRYALALLNGEAH